MPYPEIVSRNCIGCGLCAGVCTKNGLRVVGAAVSFTGLEECSGCGLCEAVCPKSAISSPFDIILDEP
ncbi:MAG: 4Fe-4S binding protein [Dehalococcoidia bacterium]|nr:4Fe-4S binding protein [Dehalococcoidia bacterium]